MKRLSHFLSYEEVVKVCKKINEQFKVTEKPFIEVIDKLFEEHHDINAEKFLLLAFTGLLKTVNQEIQKLEEKVEITPTCFKGCSYCCYFPIVITKLEGKLIHDYIHSLPKDRKMDIMGHLTTYFETNQVRINEVCSSDFQNDSSFKEKYIKNQLPCPFLDLNTNTCKAYEVRPIPCRTYLNYSDPNVCKQHDLPKETFSYEFLYDYYFGILNEVIQTLIEHGENISNIDYPSDVFEYDYLPNVMKEILKL